MDSEVHLGNVLSLVDMEGAGVDALVDQLHRIYLYGVVTAVEVNQ